MPTKKAAPATAKTPDSKSAAQAKPAATKKRTPARGEKLVCETCGIGVVVDEVTGVVLFEEIICCGKPMKPKAAAAKQSAAKK